MDGRAKPLMDRQVVEVSSLSLLIYLSIYLIISSVYLTMYLSISPSTYLSIYLPIYLSIFLSIYLPVYLQVWKGSYSARRPQVLNLTTSKNAAILRDFLNVWTWQRQKRSNSPRRLHFSKLTTSKTKQFCETSSIFELDNIKNETILRDFFIFQPWQHQKRSNSARRPQYLNLTTSKTKEFCEISFKNGKLSAALTASYQCVLRFFHSTCLKYCAYHEKLMPGHTKCCTCHAKSP